MKNVEKNGKNAVGKSVVNLKNEAVYVLKTMLLLEKNPGSEYLIQLLRGYSAYEWRSPEHTKLETFGTLRRYTYFRVRSILHILADQGYIEPGNATATILKPSEKGEKFLDEPHDIHVFLRKLDVSRHTVELFEKLRDLRRQIARQDGREVWEVFSDFTMMRIARAMPVTVEELSYLAGMTRYKVENYGVAIVSVVRERWDQLQAIRQEERMRRVQTPTYRVTKEMFLDGHTVAEIASAKNIKESTVHAYLMDLHLAGEIDLKPWIERNVDSKALYKGSEYFRQTKNPKFREAYEVLGLDYETLKFCRLYVSDYESSWDEVRIYDEPIIQA